MSGSVIVNVIMKEAVAFNFDGGDKAASFRLLIPAPAHLTRLSLDEKREKHLQSYPDERKDSAATQEPQ